MSDIVITERPGSDNGTSVILEWAAVPAAQGYVFFFSTGRTSSSLDGSKTWTRIAKSNLPVTVRALRAVGEGVYPRPAQVFGAKIPQPFPDIVGQGYMCRTYAELAAAIAKTGPTVIQIAGMIPVGTNVPLNNDTYIYGADRTKDGITGGRFLVDANRVRIRNLGITKSLYDGVKIADNKPASFVDIDGCWIRDVGDQGVLTGFQPSSDIWVRNNLIENVGTTPYGNGVADGHCIYMGGATTRWTVQNNHLKPNAFGVQCYPNPADVLITQNLIEGGVTRGGIVAYSGASGIKIVGNVIRDAPSGAMEISGATGWANDNLVWNCKNGVWTIGQLPGSNNIVGDPALMAQGFIRPVSFDYVLSANAGAA